MAPISLSSSYFFKASLSSTKRALESAFRALGLFSVTAKGISMRFRLETLDGPVIGDTRTETDSRSR